jgi:hypothetical protein
MNELSLADRGPNTVCKLCVGGVSYSTTLSTLTSVDGYLAALFSGRWDTGHLMVNGDEVFIDRDGEVRRPPRWPCEGLHALTVHRD